MKIKTCSIHVRAAVECCATFFLRDAELKKVCSHPLMTQRKPSVTTLHVNIELHRPQPRSFGPFASHFCHKRPDGLYFLCSGRIPGDWFPSCAWPVPKLPPLCCAALADRTAIIHPLMVANQHVGCNTSYGLYSAHLCNSTGNYTPHPRASCAEAAILREVTGWETEAQSNAL